MQQIPFIDLFKSALHVSGDKLAHPQEQFFTVYTAFGTMHRYCCRQALQGPKHVVSLNKDNNVRELCFDSKEPLFNNKYNTTGMTHLKITLFIAITSERFIFYARFFVYFYVDRVCNGLQYRPVVLNCVPEYDQQAETYRSV